MVKPILKSMSGILNKSLRRFVKDNAGSVAQILGLSALPVFLAAGAAVDSVRINREHAAFHAAVDSAVLAVAADTRSAIGGLSESALAARMAELKAFATDYIETNYEASTASDGEISINLNVTGQIVEITANLEFPTTIMALAGIDTVELEAYSQVKKAVRPTEVVLVMDTTGSMASGGKIDGAKTAAHTLLTRLYSGSLAAEPRSEYIRIGLVPFAAAVHLDTAAADFNLNWIDTTGINPLSKLSWDANSGTPSAWNNFYAWSRLKVTSSTFHTWNGCVEARMRGTGTADYNVNDTAPTSATPATLFPAHFTFDAPGTSSTGDTITSYGYSYIGTSGTPNECTNLSSICSSTTTSNLQKKQENHYKYDGLVIGSESTTNYGPWSGCAASKVVPMTYNRASVETGIDAMTASGPTLIVEGLMWGWRVISPGEPFTQVQGSGGIPAASISPYGDPKWRKVMVLMTDGDNDLSAGSFGYNGTINSAYGVSGEPLANNRIGTTSSSSVMTALDTDMLTACTKIKAAGIELFVSSFGSGVSTTTKARLKSCATDDEHYAHATTSSDLVAFFDHIAEDVVNKSIYVSK